jgi:hypothetical protein
VCLLTYLNTMQTLLLCLPGTLGTWNKTCGCLFFCRVWSTYGFGQPLCIYTPSSPLLLLALPLPSSASASSVLLLCHGCSLIQYVWAILLLPCLSLRRLGLCIDTTSLHGTGSCHCLPATCLCSADVHSISFLEHLYLYMTLPNCPCWEAPILPVLYSGQALLPRDLQCRDRLCLEVTFWSCVDLLRSACTVCSYMPTT